MDPLIVRRITDKYLKAVRDIEIGENIQDKAVHFRHIANNLLTFMKCFAEVLEEDGRWSEDEIRNREAEMFYRRDSRALGAYLNSIARFPEFRSAEFSSIDGFFPDIPDSKQVGRYSGEDYYAFESARRLRGQSS